MKLSIASLSPANRYPAPTTHARKPKANDAPRYAAKLVDLDDDDSPTLLRTRKTSFPVASAR